MRKWKQRAIAGMLTLVMSISNVNVPVYAQEVETISEIVTEVEATTETSEVSSEVATEDEETTEISEVSSEAESEVEATAEKSETTSEVESEVETTTEDSEISSEVETEIEATTENSEESTEESTEENLLDENQEEVATEKVYEDENYRVTFSVTSSWVSGYNANIKIENTGNDIIQNWYLSFEYDDEITNIWNAEIFSHEEHQYIVKNAGWNQDIMQISLLDRRYHSVLLG